MPTITRLSLYNGALRELGERQIASLSENREPRRVLDTAWDEGAVDFCLGAGIWRFAKRTVQLAAETGMAPEFGYQKVYTVPDDHIRTAALSADEYFNNPLVQYRFEAGFWFADVEPIFVSYVSNAANYGGDYALWPMEFVQYVHAYLAMQICTRLTQHEAKQDKLIALVKTRLNDAASGDAMEDPTVFPPMGRWVSSRLGSRSGRLDRGNRGNLIG